MHRAEQHNIIVDDQYEGRAGRTSINPVMITANTCKTVHLQRANIGRTECDAEACYDRVVPGLVSIAETNAGALEKISMLIARTLEKIEYHMSTAKGVSEEYNKHTQKELMYGSGQGTTYGLAKWMLNDNVISKTYNKKATGC
eukprot:6750892-Ditylum_brightwellii.AAC.1